MRAPGGFMKRWPRESWCRFLTGLQSPGGVAVDRDGNLYYTDTAAARVWRRSSSGTVTELGAGHWVSPRGLAVAESGEDADDRLRGRFRTG